jgi:flagellar biosynthesis GTPase FlhF
MLDVRKMFNQAKQKLGENIGRKVDAKGRTQHEWMQLVKQKFPDAKIVQAKMIDGPAHAMLPDGRKFSWTPVQGVAEVGQNFRRGNAQRAALNAMSPEERKAYEEKRAEQQRKRDEARLERERQRNAAKKGVAEAPGAETLAHNQSTVASNEKAFDLEEGKPREKEADYGADYQDMVARVKKLAGLGPLKTVYDPQKRVYKNVPRAEQPKK